MSGWTGFTEEEIQKLKIENQVQRKSGKTLKQSKLDSTERKKPRQKIPSLKVAQHSTAMENENNESKCKGQCDEQIVAKESDQAEAEETKPSDLINERNTRKSVTSDESIGVLADDKAAELQLSSLEKLQMQQKIIEDQNKKKKTLLAEALAERFKQTQSESVKLKEIQTQLHHLDQILQADVEILRNRIDEACVHYAHAQRRYEVAEKEYVESKLDYFQKKEVKEELTEHLYTIIQENEVRKAKKLEELMQKLNSDSDSLPTSPITSVPLPQPALPVPQETVPNYKELSSTISETIKENTSLG